MKEKYTDTNREKLSTRLTLNPFSRLYTLTVKLRDLAKKKKRMFVLPDQITSDKAGKVGLSTW